MNLIQKVELWGDKHHPKWIDVLRIILGIIILLKGMQFISNTAQLQTMMGNSRFAQVSFIIAHYVAFAHLLGGALIIAGLITRIAVLAQIPVLLGAVIFVNAQKGFFSADNTELWFSILILFLLLFFLVEGSGPWSVDNWMKKHPDGREWDEELKKLQS
jgi:uncharacterized membrane protein YphA (DoxX/SURF4 family)